MAEKPEAKKITKKKKHTTGYYKVDLEKIVRLRPFCERCGLGYFMADHGNRYACGHCGFTLYKHTETKQ